MEVNVHVPTRTEHRVLVDPDHAEVVRVLPQDLKLGHVRLLQLSLCVLNLNILNCQAQGLPPGLSHAPEPNVVFTIHQPPPL